MSAGKKCQWLMRETLLNKHYYYYYYYYYY